MHLKVLQKELFKIQQKQLVIWLVIIELLIELWQSQEVHHRLIQKQVQINMIKKHLKTDVYL